MEKLSIIRTVNRACLSSKTVCKVRVSSSSPFQLTGSFNSIFFFFLRTCWNPSTCKIKDSFVDSSLNIEMEIQSCWKIRIGIIFYKVMIYIPFKYNFATKQM